MKQRLSATHATQLQPNVFFERRCGQFTWFQACRRNPTLLGILRFGYPKAVSKRMADITSRETSRQSNWGVPEGIFPAVRMA
jgi:hypothetical protein